MQIEPWNDSPTGFDLDVPTICCQRVGTTGLIVQVRCSFMDISMSNSSAEDQSFKKLDYYYNGVSIFSI